MGTQRTSSKVSLLLAVGLGFSTLGCQGSALENRRASTDRVTFPESSRAALRVAELRTAFPVLGEPSPARFREADEGRVRAEISGNATARVTLPKTIDGWVELEHVSSELGLRFARVGAGNAPLGVSNGLALYSRAGTAVDDVHRVLPSGVEDFVAFAERPPVEALSYRVEVTRVAGLRRVSAALEFLDASGTPRLRVAPPYFLDQRGKRHPAALGVDGCRFDTDPRAPWGRPTVAPGAATCVVTVRWKADDYPILVDPLWTTTESMAVGRTELREAPRLPSGHVLVAGGVDDGEPLRLVEVYDPMTGTFADTSALSVPRGSAGVTALASGKVLIAGGRSGTNTWNASAEIYDEQSGEWTATAGPMSFPREGHSQNLLFSGKVLIAGGHSDNFLSDSELFDPDTETFDDTGDLYGIRALHTGTVLSDGKVLIAGGETTGTAELYDPDAEAFFPTGPMSANRGQHAAVSLGSQKALVVGGWVGYTGMSESVDTAEIYDATAGTMGEFSLVTSTMDQARRWPTATVLDSGLVLVVGGTPDGVIGLNSAELFDPAAETFSSAMTMTTGRFDHAATLLANGSVLVMGGKRSTTTLVTLSSASLYMDKSNGSSCGVGDECRSTFCVAGVCCENACTGSGLTCVSGTCEEETSGAGGDASGGSSGNGTGGANSTGGNATGGNAMGGSLGAGMSAGGNSGTGGDGSGATGGSSGTGGDGSGAAGGNSGTGGDDPGAGGDGSGTACSVDSDCASDHYCNGDVCVPRTPLENPCGCTIPGRRVPNGVVLASLLLGAGIVLRRRGRRAIG